MKGIFLLKDTHKLMGKSNLLVFFMKNNEENFNGSI